VKPLQFLVGALVAVVAGCGGGGVAAPPSGALPQGAPVASTAAPTTGPTSTPSPPAPMASTYAIEAADVSAFANAVAAQCPVSPVASTRFDVDLLQANANYLVSVLPGQTIAQAQALAAGAVAFAVAARSALPGIGFMINPVYPALVQNQANAPAWWNAAADYPVFAAYYAALARGLTQNGIPFDAEANLVFPSYSGENYGGLSLAQLEAGVAEDASNVLAVMPPQYLNIASEPLTLSENTGQASLNTPTGYAGYAAAVRNAIVVPPGSTTKIGAGSADWSATSFLTAIEGVPNLAFYDEHLYPPDFLVTPGGGIAQVESIAPAVSGKPGVVTENWDEKDAGDAAGYGVSAAPVLEQLDTYSFWAPLDAQYITAMMRFARCQNLAVVSFWDQWELFAYLDYASASTMTPAAAQSAIASAASQAAFAGQLSAAGASFSAGLTGRAPAGVQRR
jgi:hypothetical protein